MSGVRTNSAVWNDIATESSLDTGPRFAKKFPSQQSIELFQLVPDKKRRALLNFFRIRLILKMGGDSDRPAQNIAREASEISRLDPCLM
jgi:hypothetical protein